MKHSIGSLWFIGSLLLLSSCRDATVAQEGGGTSEETNAYSGVGYVGGFAQSGASVLFAVNAADQADYTLEIRYATTNAETATASLYLNGVKATEQLQLPEQHTGHRWQSIEKTVSLRKGTNAIVIQHDAADNGCFYLDYIQIKR